jgi:hypothetical protein
MKLSFSRTSLASWRKMGLAVVVALIAAIGVSACGGVRDQGVVSPQAGLIGDWVEPVPGMEHEVQGISLHENGTAASINMATLRYQRWRLEGDTLTLTGESIGNRTSSTFDEVYRVRSANEGRLELIDEQGQTRVFVRP